MNQIRENNPYREKVELILRRAVDVFHSCPDIFLTEEDVRCYLFSKLISDPILSLEGFTLDGSQSIPVHAEIRWYGARGKMRDRSDLVVIDPTDLVTYSSPVIKIVESHMASKGFAFNKFWAIIEVKLRRRNGKSDNQWLKDIHAEMNRLARLKHEALQFNPHHAQYWAVFFDKKDNVEGRIQPGIDDPDIHFKYVSHINRTPSEGRR